MRWALAHIPAQGPWAAGPRGGLQDNRKENCQGMGSSPPPGPALLCEPGGTPPGRGGGTAFSPTSSEPSCHVHPLLLHPEPLRVSHLEWLQDTGVDLPGWGPRNRGKPCQQPGVRLVYPAAQETGGGAFWGGENLEFKGTPPGSALGLGGRVRSHEGLSPDPPWLTWPFSGSVGTPPWRLETSVLTPVTLPG